MGFISFLVLLAIAYLLWRVTDQLPDLIFRLSEIQRDVAELRRAQSGDSTTTEPTTPSAPAPAPAAPSASTAGDQSSA